MKKYILLILLIGFVFLTSCQKEPDHLDYTISNDTSIEVVYYQRLTGDFGSNGYDTIILNMTGKQLLNYGVFQDLINQAEYETNNPNFVLGIPIGSYELRFFDNEVLKLNIMFKPNSNQQIDVEIYTRVDGKIGIEYTTNMAINQDIKDFMSYIQNNAILYHLPED